MAATDTVSGSGWRKVTAVLAALIRIALGYLVACLVASIVIVLGSFFPWSVKMPADEFPLLLIMMATGAVYAAMFAFPLAIVGILIAEFFTNRSPAVYMLIGLLAAAAVLVSGIFFGGTGEGMSLTFSWLDAVFLVAGAMGGLAFGLVRGRKK